MNMTDIEKMLTIENCRSITDAEDAAALARSANLVLSGVENDQCDATPGREKLTALVEAAMQACEELEAKALLVAKELRRLDKIEKAA